MDFKKKFLNLGITNRNFGKGVVHVEGIYFTHEEMKEHVKKYHPTCYCIGPINYEYSDSFFASNMTKKEFNDSLKKHYLELKSLGANIQMHVHLAYFPGRLSYSKKEEMIKSTYDFFVNYLGIVPKEVVFGWYKSDKDAEQIAHNLGLKVRREHLHVYDWWL